MSDWLEPIYAPWDGNAELMAADIEESPVTVRQWRFRGRIPNAYWPRIIAEAKGKRNCVLQLEQFFPPDKRALMETATAQAAQA